MARHPYTPCPYTAQVVETDGTRHDFRAPNYLDFYADYGDLTVNSTSYPYGTWETVTLTRGEPEQREPGYYVELLLHVPHGTGRGGAVTEDGAAEVVIGRLRNMNSEAILRVVERVEFVPQPAAEC